MKKLIINLILVIISIPLTLFFGVIGFIYFHLKMIIWTFRYKKLGLKKAIHEISKYYWLVALSIDQTANVITQYWFNDWMLKDSKIYPYGHPDQTVSHVTGYNYVNNNYRIILKWVAKFLNFLDKKHVENAAVNEQYTNKYN